METFSLLFVEEAEVGAGEKRLLLRWLLLFVVVRSVNGGEDGGSELGADEDLVGDDLTVPKKRVEANPVQAAAAGLAKAEDDEEGTGGGSISSSPSASSPEPISSSSWPSSE